MILSWSINVSWVGSYVTVGPTGPLVQVHCGTPLFSIYNIGQEFLYLRPRATEYFKPTVAYMVLVLTILRPPGPLIQADCVT